MNGDMQMARRNEPGVINLAVGEPVVVRNRVGKVVLAENMALRPLSAMSYPPAEGLPELRDLLSRLPICKGKHIVVTNGAKQALHAAIFALKGLKLESTLKGLRREPLIAASAPYWPSYPAIAKAQGLVFVGGRGTIGDIQVNASPNNPTGAVDLADCDIWDAAYASASYGFDETVSLGNKISVFSASKMYGLSGARIGWLATSDEELANRAIEFMETASAGVSTVSQEMLIRAVETHLEYPNLVRSAQQDAYADLSANASFFRQLGKHFVERAGFSRTGMGMFEFMRLEEPLYFERLLDKARVRVISGRHFGCDDSWIRISIGATRETIARAVELILDAEKAGV